MKFICYKDKIIKALNSVVKGVASKTTKKSATRKKVAK